MGICYNIAEDMVQKEVGYDLPQDVVIEILLRLPVKSIMRFRCICKLWCSLTKDVSHYYDEGSNKFRFALFPDETLALPYYQYPYLELNRDAKVLGPCNGLFCLFNGWNAVALWNPAMRQFRTLPELPLPELPSIPRWSYSVFGFGMDPKTNDYKVIWIRIFYDTEGWLDTDTFNHYIQVGVFSLSSDSWRELNGNLAPVDLVHYSKFYSYADGFYYWFAGENDINMFILSFDMVNEVFLVIPEPGGIPESVKDVSRKEYAFYESSIARILYDHDEEHTCYTIVLEDECWTKEVTIGSLLGVKIPLGFWKDGGLLVQSRTTAELVISDPITGEIKNVGIEDPEQVGVLLFFFFFQNPSGIFYFFYTES